MSQNGSLTKKKKISKSGKVDTENQPEQEIKSEDDSVYEQLPLPLFPSRCSNCFRKIGPNCRSSKQFYFEFIENGARVKKIVLISDAMKEIYQWRFFGFSEPSMDEKLESVNITVCGEVCGIAIAKLYSAIKVFDSLAHTNSDLYMLTKKLLDNFLTIANQGVNSEPTDSRKHARNLLSRNLNEDDDQKIGSDILNRPVTQYLSIQKRFIIEDGVTIQILNPEEFREHDIFPVDTEEVFQGESIVLDTMGASLNDDECKGDSEVRSSCEIDFGTPWPVKPFVSKPYLCQLCGAGLTSRQALRTHELLSHKIGTKERTYVCEVCNKEYFFQYLLRNHEVTHKKERSYECTVCDMKFKGRHGLYQHQRDVHSSNERKHKCNICPNKAFKHYRTLWDHMRSMHGNKGGKLIFACKYGCGSTTNRSRSLVHHHQICRKGPLYKTQNYVEVKAAVESIRESQNDSELDETGKRRAIYPCKYDCGKLFRDPAYRNRHCRHICRKRPDRDVQRLAPKRRLRHIHHSRPSRVKVMVAESVASNPLVIRHENSAILEKPISVSVLTTDGSTELIEIETVFEDIVTVRI